ncbi:MAG: DUF4845 domain-containing protein [Acidiferrobacterales bacterium]
MMNIGRQEGMTMWSIVSLVLIGIFFLLLAFKLVPVYIDDLKIGSAISRVAKKQGAGSKSAADLKASLQKMVDVEYISDTSFMSAVEILPRGANAKVIKLEYEVEVPLAYNISALLYFDHEYEAR